MVICHCKAEEPGHLDREVMIYTVLMDLLLCNPVLGQTPFFESWVLLVVLVLNGSLHWLYDILVLVPQILEEVAGLLGESELLIELFLFENTILSILLNIWRISIIKRHDIQLINDQIIFIFLNLNLLVINNRFIFNYMVLTII